MNFSSFVLLLYNAAIYGTDFRDFPLEMKIWFEIGMVTNFVIFKIFYYFKGRFRAGNGQKSEKQKYVQNI